MTTSEMGIQVGFDAMCVLYYVLALVVTCVVAYAVYESCKPKEPRVHETFENIVVQNLVDNPYFASRAQHITEFDQLKAPYSASTMSETPTRQHMEEALVSLQEFAGKVAEHQYGVVQVAEEDLPMHALKCMWGKKYCSAGEEESQIHVTLAITVFVQFNVNTMNYIQMKTFDVDLTVDDSYTSFIPINNYIINRKITNRARIIRVCMERRDTNTSVLCVEKVAVVKYNGAAGTTWNGNLSDDDNVDAYRVLSGKRGVSQDKNNTQFGNRSVMGILLHDPVCLVAQQHTPPEDQTVYSVACSSALIADVSYTTRASTYGVRNTLSFKVQVSFTSVESPTVTLYFASVSAGNTNDFKQYVNGDTLTLLADTVQTNSASRTTGDVLNILHPHNVAQATLYNVEPNAVYECTIALTERQTGGASFCVVALDNMNQNTRIQTMHCVPLHGLSTNTPSLLLLDGNNQTMNGNYTRIPSVFDVHASSLFSDYLVDADSSIVRLEQHPGNTDENHLSECNVFSVNDGLVFYGSLQVPHHNGLTNNTQLFSLSLLFANNRRLVMQVTRDGVFVYEKTYLSNKSIKTLSNSIIANDVSWYMYIYKKTIGIQINQVSSVTNHDMLKDFYVLDGTDMVDAYPVMTNINMTLEKNITMKSRLITAITTKPTPSDMTRMRADMVELIHARPSLLYRKSTNTDSNTTKPYITRSLGNTMSNDSGISWHCEITKESILEAIQTYKDTLYRVDPKYPNKEKEVTVVENETVKIVLQKQRVKKPDPRMFDIAVYFTQSCGSFVAYPKVLASYKIFQQTNKGVTPRVVIKYSNYKKAERVCVVRYDQQYQGARVYSSASNQLSLRQPKPFKKVKLHTTLVHHLVCGASILSTNCNPYNTEKMCDCTGRITADPNKFTTNHPCMSTFNEAMSSESTGTYIENPVEELPMDSADDCVKYAGTTYGELGVASFTGNEDGTTTCAIAKHPVKLGVSKDKEASQSYIYRNMCEEDMRFANLLSTQ